MTNPSETRDSELVAGLGLHDDSEPTLAGLTRIVRDGYLPDDYRSSARAAYDKLREAADTIDRLTSTGEAVAVPHYSSKDAEFDRLLALGTAEANEFLTWLKANPGETLSPFAQRALAHTFGFIMDKAASPREGHVEVPTETLRKISEIIEKSSTIGAGDFFAIRAMLAALPHNQGETKP